MYTDTDQARYDIFKSRYEPKSGKKSFSIDNGINLSLLPLTHQHFTCTPYEPTTNHTFGKIHTFPVKIPSPINNGWKLDESRNFSVDWTSGDILPLQLVDLVSPTEPESSNAEPNECSETNYVYQFFKNEIEEDDEIDNIIDVIFEDEQDIKMIYHTCLAR